MLLADPTYTVPDPGPPGPYGTLAWLRATVSRFCEGETHARRRAIVEVLLAGLDPADLRDGAARMTAPAVDPPYIPVAVLAAGLGVAADDLGDAVAATRLVAAAYHPHSDAPGADEALERLLALLPGGGDAEVVAARVAILVQACEATAGLVRGDDLPVPMTRRVDPDGRTVLVDLSAHPFGAGPRRCPGEAHALGLVEGVLAR